MLISFLLRYLPFENTLVILHKIKKHSVLKTKSNNISTQLNMAALVTWLFINTGIIRIILITVNKFEYLKEKGETEAIKSTYKKELYFYFKKMIPFLSGITCSFIIVSPNSYLFELTSIKALICDGMLSYGFYFFTGSYMRKSLLR